MQADIQRYIRSSASEGRETERVGPFLATFHPRDPLRYRNYAIPDDGAEPTAADVAALVAAYERRDRMPRVELVPACAPRVEAALLAGGFAVEARIALMTCARAADVEPPAGILLERPASEEDLRGLLSAQAAAFGMPPPDDAAVAEAADGALRVLAREAASGLVVGGGLATRPASGISEIGGIAVLASHRRRGIATALTARLARELLQGGVTTVFLTPGDEGARRAYVRAGFADAGEMLHLSIA
jgi:ribosomal protein S18 acetylase RimI-like enzyme